MNDWRVRALTVALVLLAASSTFAIASGQTVEKSKHEYVLSFNESGLWPGWEWSIVVNGTTYSTTQDALNITVRNGVYNYTDIATNEGVYSVNVSSGSVTVHGANATVYVGFSPDEEVGEIAGEFTGWTVPIGDSVNFNWGIINYGAPTWMVIQYPYFQASEPGRPSPIFTVGYAGFVLMPYALFYDPVTITVPDNGTDAGVSWEAIAGATADYNGSCGGGACIVPGVAKIISGSAYFPYFLNFTESGLPAGSAWSVNAAGGWAEGSSTSTLISTIWQNGTWPYVVSGPAGYIATPSSGNVTIAGNNVTLPIHFKPAKYPVTFQETGLPLGTSWSVSVGSVTHTTTSDAITFNLVNGTYAYSVANVPNYSRTPSGTFSVTGSAVDISAPFALVKYPVKFKETGLARGTSWNVTIGARVHTSTLATIDYQLSNGSREYTVGASNPDYTASGGSVTVDGTSVLVSVTFTKGTTAPTPPIPVTRSSTMSPTPGLVGSAPGATSLTAVVRALRLRDAFN